MTFEEFCSAIGLDPEPFQKRIVRAAHGPERELVVLLPRGNGKTHLLAALALHHLLTVENAAVYCAAASRDQARILYEAASGFARRLDHPNLVVRHLELRYCDDPTKPKVFSRHLRVLASDAMKLHGLTPSLSICDEMHAHADDQVYLAMATSLLKRPGSKLVTISTAGHGADSPLGRLRARAMSQPSVKRRGACTDARGPSLRLLEWAVPEDGDVDDAREVKKANPASWLTVAGLHEQREAVPDAAYRQLHANQWTAPEGHWLPSGAWQSCVGEVEFTPGEHIWIGVDVGGQRSATAVAWVAKDDGAVTGDGLTARARGGAPRLRVGCAIYHGDGGVLDAVEKIRELAAEYDVQEVAFDPWRFGQAAQEFEQSGLTVAPFPQNATRMVPASATLYELIVQGRLTLPDDPEFARHAADAISKHSERGWRIGKPNARTNIDALIALAMAVDYAMTPKPPVEVLGWV